MKVHNFLANGRAQEPHLRVLKARLPFGGVSKIATCLLKSKLQFCCNHNCKTCSLGLRIKLFAQLFCPANKAGTMYVKACLPTKAIGNMRSCGTSVVELGQLIMRGFSLMCSV